MSAMNEQEIDQQYENQEEEQQNDYYQDDNYYDVDSLSLQPSLSKDQPYAIYQLDELIKKIWEEINQKASLCCMTDGWTLMLYSFTNFNSSYFDDLLDQDNTGRNIIKYREEYYPGKEIGQCGVCLGEEELISNTCGHKFCINCWRYHVELSLTDRNIYQLFPLCQQEGCYHRVNYHLIEQLWQNYPSLHSAFNKLLCHKYSQQSIRVKLCPNQVCGKAIYMNSVVDSTVECECKTEVCRHCGAEGHWPLHCQDLRSWNSMASGREDQWINSIVTQRCPMCRQNIEKNDGCIHMTCFCKYEFCWICLKVWKGHSNYYACSSVSRDDHETRLKEEQAKKKLDQNLYNQRLEEARSQTERLTCSIKRICSTCMQPLTQRLKEALVMDIHSKILIQMQEFIKKAWALVYRCAICYFFQREASINLKRVIFRIDKAANLLDDFITDILPTKFKKVDETIAKRQGTQKNIAEIENINLKFYFQQEKDKYTPIIREGLRIMELIKIGEINKALSQVSSQNCPLYLEHEPSLDLPAQEEQMMESEEQEEQEFSQPR